MTDVGILPIFPGQGWSVIKAPTWQTRIQRSVSGRELRALDYPYPLWQFTLTYNALRDPYDIRQPTGPGIGYNELRQLMGFYMKCQGAFGTFLYDDPTDNVAGGQGVSPAYGDGVTTFFQLLRAFGTQDSYFVEPITAPNVVTALYLNGVSQPINNPYGWAADPATGLMSISPPVPLDTLITVDLSYYFRCRFIDDSYQFDNFMYQLWQLKKLSFISVLP